MKIVRLGGSGWWGCLGSGVIISDLFQPNGGTVAFRVGIFLLPNDFGSFFFASHVFKSPMLNATNVNFFEHDN